MVDSIRSENPKFRFFDLGCVRVKGKEREGERSLLTSGVSLTNFSINLTYILLFIYIDNIRIKLHPRKTRERQRSFREKRGQCRTRIPRLHLGLGLIVFVDHRSRERELVRWIDFNEHTVFEVSNERFRKILKINIGDENQLVKFFVQNLNTGLLSLYCLIFFL